MEFTQTNPTQFQQNPTFQQQSPTQPQTLLQQQIPTPPQQVQPVDLEEENDDIVPYNKFDPARFVESPAETKQVPYSKEEQEEIAKGGKVAANYYHTINFKYNVSPDPAIKNTKDLLFEGAEVFSPSGLIAKPGKSGRMEYSIMVKYNLGKKDQAEMIAALDKLHYTCAVALQKQRGSVKLHSFSAEHAEMCGFKNPTYRARDPVSSEYIEGASPTCFLKLFKRQNGSTLFTRPDGTPIDWRILQNAEVTFIPLIHFKRIYVGSKPSLQSELKSAIVTSAVPQNSNSLQQSTMKRLMAMRPDLANTVAAQIAKLTTEKQEFLVGNNENSTSETTNPSSDAPTFVGVIPSSAPTPSAPTSGVPSPVQLPQITQLPTMQDFTASAPPRQAFSLDVPVIPTMQLS